MKDEMDSFMSNQTWQLAQLPRGQKALHNKWVDHIKEEHDNSKRYKTRFVVKGFQQKEGIDYNEIFSPVINIAHVVGVASKCMSNPRKQHWEAMKWILRYLRGIASLALCFKQSDLGLQGYVDADMAGDVDDRKSSIGYVYTLGGTTISWVSKLQKKVTLSITEAEYVAVTEASKEMIWLQTFLEELGQRQWKGVLHCDSQSAIHLVKNRVYHENIKHIQVRYHFIRSTLEDRVLVLQKILKSLKYPADMLTKTVPVEKLKLCVTSVGLLLEM